jgi:hypothetical protein
MKRVYVLHVTGSRDQRVIRPGNYAVFNRAAEVVSLVPSKRHARRAKADMEAGLARCRLRIYCVLGESNEFWKKI